MLPVLGTELTHAEDGTKPLLLLQKTLTVSTLLIAEHTAGQTCCMMTRSLVVPKLRKAGRGSDARLTPSQMTVCLLFG